MRNWWWGWCVDYGIGIWIFTYTQDAKQGFVDMRNLDNKNPFRIIKWREVRGWGNIINDGNLNAYPLWVENNAIKMDRIIFNFHYSNGWHRIRPIPCRQFHLFNLFKRQTTSRRMDEWPEVIILMASLSAGIPKLNKSILFRCHSIIPSTQGKWEKFVIILMQSRKHNNHSYVCVSGHTECSEKREQPNVIVTF